MSKAYDDSRYLARTLAASMLELAPDDQNGIVSFFQDELRRLGIASQQPAAPVPHERGGHSLAGSADHLNSGAAASPN
jgi:hypothetical protein